MKPLTIALPTNQTIDLIYVEGGEFVMGDDDSDFDREKPAHPVKVFSFYIGKYPVTQSQWQAIAGENLSGFKGDNRPVENVSWDSVQEFIHQLNQETNKQFCLPTEAEWEYAARGGKYSQGTTYSGSDKLKQVGWYEENSGNETHDVGMMLANELGIHDMSGNVWEWCADWNDEKYYEECKKKGVVENPSGPDTGADRVLRGGSGFEYPLRCRSASRPWDRPTDLTLGFRLVLRSQSAG